jgi:hypothetical protein
MPRYISIPVTCEVCDEVHAVYIDVAKANPLRPVEFTCPNANKRVAILGYPPVARMLISSPPANAITGEVTNPS